MGLKEKLLESNLVPWTKKNCRLYVLGIAGFVLLLVLPMVLIASAYSEEKWTFLTLLIPVPFAIVFGLVNLGVGRSMNSVRASVQ